MDRISKSLLDEFARDHTLENLAEEVQFEHFASYLAISRHHSDSFDTRDIVTGSGGDTGIDAIAIIVNGVVVTDAELVPELADTNGYLDVTFIFVQAKRSASFDTSKIGQFEYGVLDFFRERPMLPRNNAVQDAAKIMFAIYERSSKFKGGNPSCRLYYVTTGKWTSDVNLETRRLSAVEAVRGTQLFNDVQFVPVDADMIQKLYRQTKNALSCEFTFSRRTVMPDIPGVTQAYLGIVSAKEFMRLIQDDAGELIRSIFYDNVRDWQDYNSVNTEIRGTLTSESTRSRFVLMNNGITVITKTLRPTADKLYIEDYQIVNGCQTSHVLFHQLGSLDDSVMIPLRLIQTQDEEVITSIIKATNRQTEVREEQLLALSDFQKKLEFYFGAFEPAKRLYYERRLRQFNSVPNIEKTRIVMPSALIRAYASMFLEEPHRTTRSYKGLLDRVGSTIFGTDHRLDPYYLADFAHYRLEYLFRNQLLDAKYKPARYHLLLAFRLLASPADIPRPNSHDMERYCNSLLDLLWDTVRAENLYKQAIEAVERVANGDLDNDHIRTQPFTEALKNDCKVQGKTQRQ